MRIAAGGPSRGDTRWHADCVFLLVAIAGLLLARIPVIPVEIFDPDEFEHAHAAWSVWRGLLPYRDFFEHHTPWYYLALSPVLSLVRGRPVLRERERFLPLRARPVAGADRAVGGLVYRVGRLGGEPPGGSFGGAVSGRRSRSSSRRPWRSAPTCSPWPSSWAGSGSCCVGCPRIGTGPATGLRRLLAGGLCLGAAVMCTQKMLFVLPGALAGLGLWVLAGRGRRWRARILARS